MRKWISALVAMSAMAFTATAGADPGNGAQTIKYSDCWTDDVGMNCQEVKGVVNFTENENNISIVFNRRSAYSFTGTGQYAGCNSSLEANNNRHFVFRKDQDEYQVQHSQLKNNFVIECDYFTLNYQCTSHGAFHYANGEWRYERYEFVCEPS